MELVSFLIVPMVAAQGTYSRQNTIMQYAFKGPKPSPASCPVRDAIPEAEFTLLMPKSTQKLLTTTSFAEMPEISATPICHMPSPAGARIGSIQWPRASPKLSYTSVTMPWAPKFKRNQIIIEAIIIIPPIFFRYCAPFSHV